MTKREALHFAIDVLRKQPETKTSLAAIDTLHKIESEVCRHKWTREEIINAFDKWKQQTNMPPVVSNLGAEGLPSKFVVEHVFGEKASVVLRELFKDSACRRSYCDLKYRSFTTEQLLNFFKEQILLVKPISGRDYNVHRLQGSPVWETGAKKLNCNSWKEFCAKVMGDSYIDTSTRNYTILRVEVTSPLTDALHSVINKTEGD